MNFNLVTLRESESIERLTCITIVLAKVTIVFLPLGLVTRYFGMQLTSITHLHSMATYWVSVVVVAVLSALFVVFVGSSTGGCPS